VRVLSPTPDRFRGLARSSPWRWRALAFDLHRRPVHGPDHTLHAVVERGIGIEVWLADGERRRALAARSTAAPARPVGGAGAPHTVELPYAWELPVPLGPDGFVQRRPGFPGTSDDPMWQDYEFVALLDPVELADGWPREPPPGWRPDAVRPPALDLHGLDASTRQGRATWWAEVSPTDDYSPRCSCCPLLFGRVSESLDTAGGRATAQGYDRDPAYASAYLVALDVQTGVCVHVEHLDGDHAGRGFSVDISSVDGGVDGGTAVDAD
jgi:hypothetical protein